MKKLLISSLFIGGFLFASPIKDNSWFVNANIGSVKIQDSDTEIGIGIGYYFYDPNIYKINNRISLDFQKVNSDANFYITSLKLDWIKNNSGKLAPYLGLNVGYLHFKNNGYDYSTNVWGFQGGLLFSVTPQIDIDLEAIYQKAYEKQDIWNTPLKTFKIGVNFNF